jgi:hypothetical protein
MPHQMSDQITLKRFDADLGTESLPFCEDDIIQFAIQFELA